MPTSNATSKRKPRLDRGVKRKQTLAYRRTLAQPPKWNELHGIEPDQFRVVGPFLICMTDRNVWEVWSAWALLYASLSIAEVHSWLNMRLSKANRINPFTNKPYRTATDERLDRAIQTTLDEDCSGYP